MVQAKVVTQLTLDNDMTKPLKKAEGDIKGFGAGSAAAFGGAAAAGLLAVAAFSKILDVGKALLNWTKDFALESIKFANVQVQVENGLARVEKTMGSLGGHTSEAIKQFASMRQSMTTFSDEETLRAATNLATFGNVQGKVFTDGLAMAQDMAFFMKADLFTTVTGLAKALNDPVTGMALLTKQGSLTKLEAKAIGDELLRTGDIMTAQRAILDALATQYGGASEGIGDFGSKVTQLGNAWGDVKEEVGKALIEALEDGLPPIEDLIDMLAVLQDEMLGIVDIAVDIANSGLFGGMFEEGESAAHNLIVTIGELKLALIDAARLAALTLPGVSGAIQASGLDLNAMRADVLTGISAKAEAQDDRELKRKMDKIKRAVQQGLLAEEREKHDAEREEESRTNRRDKRKTGRGAGNTSVFTLPATEEVGMISGFIGSVLGAIDSTIATVGDAIPTAAEIEAFADTAIKRPIDDKAFTASITSAGGLFDAISSAAASSDAEPLNEAKKQTGFLGELLTVTKDGTITLDEFEGLFQKIGFG